MATKTFLFKDATASGSNAGSLQDGGTITNAATLTKFQIASATFGSDVLQSYNTTSTAEVSPDSSQPSAAPANSARDSWRTESPLSGTFAAGNWVLTFALASSVNNGNDGGFEFRIWRSANANGTAATEVTSGIQVTNTSVESLTEYDVSSTISLPSVTLANEYLFVELAFLNSGGGSGSNQVHTFLVGTARSFVTTPNFVLPVPTLVQHAASSSDERNVSGGNDYQFSLPNPVLAGNCLILQLNYSTSANTPGTASVGQIIDSSGDQWSSTPAVSVGDGTVTSSAYFVLPNARAGVHKLTVHFNITGPNLVMTVFQYKVSEYYNIATVSPLNGTHSTAAAAANSLTFGTSFTPGNNDANGGNLILAAFVDRALPPTMPTDYVAGGSFDLLDTVPGEGCSSHSQAWVQTTAAAVTPTATLTGGGTDGYNGVAIALKAAAAGTVPSGLRVVHLVSVTDINIGTSKNIRFPCSGNCLVLVAFPNVDTPGMTLSDDGSNAYVNVTPGTDAPQMYLVANASTSLTRKITATLSPADTNNWHMVLYDLAQVEPFGPLDGTAYVATLATPVNQDPDLINSPTITPKTNGITIAAVTLGQGPLSAVTAPEGAVLDLPWYPEMSDGSLASFGNGRAHFFNNSLEKQRWNWTLVQKTGSVLGTDYSSGAIHLRGIPVFVAATGHEPLGCFSSELIVKSWWDEELIVRRGWFDPELLGSIIVYETKGAFSGELT